MLTAMTEDDWAIVLQVFRAVRSRRGDKGRDDRKFLEALHYFTVHNITVNAGGKLHRRAGAKLHHDGIGASLIGLCGTEGGCARSRERSSPATA